MAFFKYGATVNIKKQASLDIIAKDVPEVSHTADKISAKKDDNFVYFWTRAVSADVPNLNSDLFPLDELKKAYPTFIGRGLYMDHNAQSVANAVGKVFDAKLLEDPTATEEEGRYYVGCLCGVDKTTHPDIAAKVAHGVIDSVSMGASCGSCQCNICNRVCHTPEEFCVHLQHQGQIDPETGKKCISINRDVNFSELSLVGVPADPMAKMQQVFAEFVGGLNKSASLEKEAENSFLEKFSFSIPCGNEKICETLFNVLTGYKKQGISDLSMDGSILKLSVEAKNEDLAKQKLEKISEEQGLGVEQPLEKEENLMPKEEIKPVEEQVEKKAGIVPTEDVTLDNGTTYTVRYNPTEQSILSVMQDGKEVGIDGGTRLQILRKLFHKDEPTIVEEKTAEVEDTDTDSYGYIYSLYVNGNLTEFNDKLQQMFEKGPSEFVYFMDYLEDTVGLTSDQVKAVMLGKAMPKQEAEEQKDLDVHSSITQSDIDKIKEDADSFIKNKYGGFYYVEYSNDEVKNKKWVDTYEEACELAEQLKQTYPYVDIYTYSGAYPIMEEKERAEKTDLQEVESSKTQSNEVKEVKAEENKETKKEDLVPGVSKEDTKKSIEHDLAKEKEEAKGGEDETKDIETLEKAIKETDKGALSKVIDLLKKFIGGEAKEGEDLKDYKSDDLVKKLEEKTAELETKADDTSNLGYYIAPFVDWGGGKYDYDGSSLFDRPEFHHIKTYEEAKQILDGINPEDYAEYSEDGKGLLTLVIYEVDKREMEAYPLEDKKTFRVNYPSNKQPADKKASIEEPVNNVVNTVAEPVMDHIEAKPEVPAQSVPEVKEEVEEKKEEVKPSKDVKTKEDAVKVLEDVLKAGEEADVKELGKVLDFLKSDKKEEKKDEVKEEKVEEKAEPKKEYPVNEEKKAEVEEPLEVEAKKEPTKEPEAKCEAEVKEEAKPLFANVTRVSLLKTANLIDSKWVFHFKGTDKVACLSVKNLLPGVSEKVAYLTSKEFYNEMMDTLTKKQAFDGEAVKQIVANYNEKIKVGSDEAKSQVSKATSKAKNETDGKKVSDTSKAVDTKLTDDGKEQKQDKVNSKEDAGAIESATKKAPAETDIKVSAELEAKCKQLTAALEAKEAEVSQMKMQQELAAKTAKARQIVEKSIKCGLVQCNETFRQEELLKQASPLKAKEEAMKRTADSMVADLLALSDEELDKQASYLSNFKVEAEVKQLKPIKIEASCEQSEDEDLIKALGAEMW